MGCFLNCTRTYFILGIINDYIVGMVYIVRKGCNLNIFWFCMSDLSICRFCIVRVLWNLCFFVIMEE